MKALLIDYGSGNLRSAAKALEAAGFSVAVAQDPKASLWLFGAVVVLQIPNIIITLRSGGFVEDGLLTWDALSPASGALFLVLTVCAIVRLRRQREDDES